MLTTKEIEHAKPQPKPYRLFDSLGLYIEIAPNGSKLWRVKYKFFKKENRLALGRYPEISLLEAREKRDQARKLLAEHIDPATEKKDRRNAALANLATTFELVAREWHHNHKERWTPEYAQDILHRMEMDIFTQLGNSLLQISSLSKCLAIVTKWLIGSLHMPQPIRLTQLMIGQSSSMREG